MNYGYIRVSTEHQDNSAEAQAAKLEPLCDRVFTDVDVSGSVPLRDRPAGKQLCDLLTAGDTVVITTRDRAFRNLLDSILTLQDWREQGIKLRMLDFPIDLSSDEGELMFQLLTVFAQYERKMTKRRTKAVFAHKREKGQPYGQLRPYGWKRNGDGWEEFPEERKIGSLICGLRAAGQSWTEVCLALCRQEIRKPYCRAGAAGWYRHQDVQCLAAAAAAGYPVRPQSSWRGPASVRSQRAG
jgi:DNA invertase Pin-like site-specific DNA recombinase